MNFRKAKYDDIKSITNFAMKLWIDSDLDELSLEFEEILKNGCNEIASDTELVNTESQQFHKNIGFEEVNRIVCYTQIYKA